MRSPSMPNLFGSSSPDHPPPDLHNKLQAEPPHLSKTDTTNSVMRTFSASKALIQVLGMREPEPLATPPAVPITLADRFEAGLPDYGHLNAAGVSDSRDNERLTTCAPSRQGKTILTDILEEKESPVHAISTQCSTISANDKLKIDVPRWTSEKRAVAAAQQYVFSNKDSDGANDTSSQHTSYASDEDHGLWKHGSSTTLAVSDCSRPGSASSGPTLPPSSFPPRISSLLPRQNHGTASPSPQPVIKKPSGPQPTSTRHIMPGTGDEASREALSYLLGGSSSLKRSESLPVLFPSPGVAPAPKKYPYNEIAQRYARRYNKANGFSEDDDLGAGQHTTMSPTPRITIQAPSPVKSIKSRKRGPSSTTQDEFEPPLAQRSRHDDTTGLPVLPLRTDAIWRTEFPGNTHALLTILLTWSHTMWTLSNRLPDPKLFSIHSAFPYPITPPVRKQLVSVSFYDTTVSPHKEIRFLGPGDAAEMSYHEVDVFADPTHITTHPTTQRSTSPTTSIKQTLGLAGKQPSTPTRYTSMSQRAKSGTGRWCYVLLKAHLPSDNSTAPHLMLAWHASTVTSTSTCLHTLFTDELSPASVAPQKSVKRFTSLQNLAHSLRSSKRGWYHGLRTASSASELPPVDPYAVTERDGVALLRTVVKMEKAGGVPLVEGFGVDVPAFRGWMEACGRGTGKVIMWTERE